MGEGRQVVPRRSHSKKFRTFKLVKRRYEFWGGDSGHTGPGWTVEVSVELGKGMKKGDRSKEESQTISYSRKKDRVPEVNMTKTRERDLVTRDPL